MSLQNVPAHAHCEICQTPVAVGERFCGSAECKEAHEAALKEKKRAVWKMVLIIGAAVAIAALFRY